MSHILPFCYSQDMIPQKPTQTYAPRAFGFKVNEASLYYLNREGDRQQQPRQDDTATARSNRRTKRTSSNNMSNGRAK
jgi:hypothetical protein